MRHAAAGALIAGVLVAGTLATPSSAASQEDDSVERVTVREGSIYMLVGRGGNVGVSVGSDGVFLVDDKFAPMTDEIRAAVAEVSDEEVRWVFNTHWHGDHTGGNESFGEAGSLIVAHDNVYRRLNPEEFRNLVGSSEQTPEAGLPVVTFSESVTFHWNDDDIRAVHIEHAHTDGDAFVHFPENDVLHMGDLFFNGFYPFIDVESGGSIHGMIAGAEAGLERAGPETRIMPGHGPLTDADGLREYLTMLRTVRDRVQELIDQGMSEDEVVAEAPTADFDDEWGGSDFMPPDRFVRLVYRGMVEDR